jgi:hypothetical protein
MTQLLPKTLFLRDKDTESSDKKLEKEGNISSSESFEITNEKRMHDIEDELSQMESRMMELEDNGEQDSAEYSELESQKYELENEYNGLKQINEESKEIQNNTIVSGKERRDSKEKIQTFKEYINENLKTELRTKGYSSLYEREDVDPDSYASEHDRLLEKYSSDSIKKLLYDDKSWINKHLRGEYHIDDTNEDVLLGKVGTDKVTSHSMGDYAHLKSIFAIPDLLKNAIFIEEYPNEKGNDKFDSYRYYVCGLNIGGNDYTVKLIIGFKQGKKYYDHSLTEIEKGKLLDSLSGITTPGFNQKESLPSVGKDTRLFSILQTNSSNHVVIQTGEGNSVVALDVFKKKDNVEIVGRREIDEKGLERMKRQAEREGEQLLILSPKTGSAAALSALPSDLSSAGKDTESADTKQGKEINYNDYNERERENDTESEARHRGRRVRGLRDSSNEFPISTRPSGDNETKNGNNGEGISGLEQGSGETQSAEGSPESISAAAERLGSDLGVKPSSPSV